MGGFKKKLQRGYRATGIMLTIFDNPEIVRILHNNGFDYFFFDTEHGYANYDRLYPMFAYARYEGIAGFLRIPEINKTEILRAVEMGVDGIFAPIVETADQARELVEHAKYYPKGSRGVNFMRPHTAYRKIDPKKYVDKANDEMFLVCLVESPRGVENVDAILEVDGIDAIMIGHNDLSQSMGLLGQTTHEDYLAAVETVLASCKKHGKFSGLSLDTVDQMAESMRRGVSLNQWSSDVALFAKLLSSNLPSLQAYQEETFSPETP